MNERLLQFIWQFQYFNKANLTTVEGENLQIIYPGNLNSNQGADFLIAKLKIGNTIWVGSIELHLYSSFWKTHKHNDDKNYNNVILHVVWQHNANFDLPFSTLILQDKISKLLLEQYERLMNTNSFIPCEKNIHLINELTLTSWKERLLAERLQTKSQIVFDYLKTNNNHWEESFWWLLAKNFGGKINGDAFEKMAQSISINILAKHKNQIHQIEALLFGQAGFLNDFFLEDYSKLLQREYLFLNKKHKLKSIEDTFYFLRMRPANFPTLRLAQLAMLIHYNVHLFSKIKEAINCNEIKKLLNVTANDYWHYHYQFDEKSEYKQKHLGKQTIDSILINTIITILYAYGEYHKENSYKEKAIKWLLEISPEKNKITNGFTQLNLLNKNAFDSQAFIQLKNEYCNKKRCLHCAIGNKILKINSN